MVWYRNLTCGLVKCFACTKRMPDSLVWGLLLQSISAVFEHSVLRLQEIYALEIAVFYIAVYGP